MYFLTALPVETAISHWPAGNFGYGLKRYIYYQVHDLDFNRSEYTIDLGYGSNTKKQRICFVQNREDYAGQKMCDHIFFNGGFFQWQVLPAHENCNV